MRIEQCSACQHNGASGRADFSRLSKVMDWRGRLSGNCIPDEAVVSGRRPVATGPADASCAAAGMLSAICAEKYGGPMGSPTFTFDIHNVLTRLPVQRLEIQTGKNHADLAPTTSAVEHFSTAFERPANSSRLCISAKRS